MMMDGSGKARGRAAVAGESIRVAVGSILRAPPAKDPAQLCFGRHVLSVCGRSLTGLNEANVARAARIAIDTFEPLIQVRDVAVEMTPMSAVNAITVRYEIIESGALQDIRVEIPT
jgi:phage baseplate assembly protein W